MEKIALEQVIHKHVLSGHLNIATRNLDILEEIFLARFSTLTDVVNIPILLDTTQKCQLCPTEI